MIALITTTFILINNVETINNSNMRKYTDKEKFYIRQLVEKSKEHECFLAINLFDPVLNGNGNTISVDLKNNHLIYYQINTKPAAWIDSNSCYQTLDVSCFLEIESRVVELALLIKDLLDNRLIYFLDEGNTGEQDDMIFKASGFSYHVTKSLDTRLVDILSNCAHKPVLCLPELVILKENNFVLEEDRRHSELIQQKQLEAEENLKAAKKSNKTAIIIAICSSLGTGLLSALIAQCIPMTINQKQVKNEIIQQINEPVQRLDSLVEHYVNMGTDEKIDSIQVVLKNDLESISTKLDNIISIYRRITK